MKSEIQIGLANFRKNPHTQKIIEVGFKYFSGSCEKIYIHWHNCIGTSIIYSELLYRPLEQN